MPRCAPGCYGDTCEVRKKVALWTREGGDTMTKIDYDRLADEFIRTVGGGNYSRGQRILKQAIEEGRMETSVRKVATTPPAPTAPAPVTREALFTAMSKRAAEVFPRVTPERALDQYIATPEGAACWSIYDRLPAEARVRPEPVEKVFHPNSAKARAWNAINDRATQIMEEELQRAHGAKSFSGITREQAILRAVTEDPGLYTAFVNASDEPVGR